MTDAELLKKVRERAWHYLGAGAGGLSLHRMQQLCVGSFSPRSSKELKALARAMQIK